MASAYLPGPTETRLARFWLGMLLFCLPAFWRILSHSASRQERVLLLVASGVFSYLPKIFACPQYFCLPGELSWWRGVQNLLDGTGMPGSGPSGPGASAFPGMPMLTALLQQTTGESIFHTGLILTGILHVLGLVAVFLLAERMFLSQRAGAAAALVYLSLPGFLWSSTQFSGAGMAGTLLVVALLAAQALAESSEVVDRPGWGMALLGLILAIVVTHPGAALVFAVILTMMALAARLLPRLTILTAPHTLWKYALFASIAAAAWLFTFAVDSILPIWQAMQNAFQQSVQTLPVLFTPRGLPAVGVLLIVLFLAGFGLRLIFRMGLPVMAASFGILASGVLLIVTFPLLVSGASNGTYLPWMVTSLGASLLSGLALAWLSSRRGDRDPRALRVIRQAGVVLAPVLLLAGGLLMAPPYPSIPGLRVLTQPGALKPGHMEAAQWMLSQAGPGNRLMSDEQTMQVFSSYGLQEPAYHLPGALPAAMDAPTWNYDALYSIIRTKTSFFALDETKSDQAGSTLGDIRSASLGKSPAIPIEAFVKYDELPFMSRIYDAGSLRIYQLYSSQSSQDASTGANGLAKRKMPVTEQTASLSVPGSAKAAETLLVFVMMMGVPGTLAGMLFFADWKKMDLITRAVLAVSLSVVIDCAAGFLATLTPAGIQNGHLFVLVWIVLSTLLLYQPILQQAIHGIPIHLPSVQWISDHTTDNKKVPAAAAFVLIGSLLAGNMVQAMRPTGSPGTVFSLELSAPLRVRVESHEKADQSYYLMVQTNSGRLLISDVFRIHPAQAKEIDLTNYIPAISGNDVLTIDLMAEGQNAPYRSLHLPATQADALIQKMQAKKP